MAIKPETPKKIVPTTMASLFRFPSAAFSPRSDILFTPTCRKSTRIVRNFASCPFFLRFLSRGDGSKNSGSSLDHDVIQDLQIFCENQLYGLTGDHCLRCEVLCKFQTNLRSFFKHHGLSGFWICWLNWRRKHPRERVFTR